MKKAPDLKIDFQKVVGSIFDALKVDRVLFIDDQLEIPRDERLITMALRRDREKITSIRQLEGCDWDEADDLVQSDLKQILSRLPGEESSAILQTAFECLEPDELKTETYAALSRLLPLKPNGVSPDQWRSGAFNGVLTSEGRRSMLFVDLHLTDSAQDFGGAQIVGSLHGLKLEPAPVTVLFTNEVPAKEDDEKALWAKICQDQQLPGRSFIVISKSRLSDFGNFATCLKGAFLNTLAQEVGNWAGEVARKSLVAAEESIKKIDGDILNEIILKASEREGVLPQETLFRLFDRYAGEARRGLATAVEGHGASFQRITPSIKALSEIPGGEGNSVSAKVRGIRHNELYDADLGKDDTVLPPWLGDVFSVKTVDGHETDYVLIGPMCDLILRGAPKSIGTRGAKSVVLVPVDKGISKTQEGQERTVVKLPYFNGPEYKDAFLNFKNAKVANLVVLDYVTLVCSRKGTSATGHIHASVAKRTAIVQQLFDEVKRKSAREMGRRQGIMSRFQQGALWRRLVMENAPKLFLDCDAATTTSSTGPRAIRYFVKRISRVNEAMARSILQSYAEFVNRPSLDFDFAQDHAADQKKKK